MVVSRCLGIGPLSGIPSAGRCICWPTILSQSTGILGIHRPLSTVQYVCSYVYTDLGLTLLGAPARQSGWQARITRRRVRLLRPARAAEFAHRAGHVSHWGRLPRALPKVPLAG